ncbi:MAG: DSD1 family PLP-dependent enzyme [Oscillospiraceae bacterium]|nr:DSD1 family PLP-dependent enzyme [Oscillospiraceae bacterium]
MAFKPSIKTQALETPALIIEMDALESNIRMMSEFFKDKKAKLRPHFKTHKSPEIARMQVAAGAKGLTCAKLGEAEVLVGAGIKDILIANQIVDKGKLNRLAGLARFAKMGVCADNADNIADLSKAAQYYGSTLHVLVEINVGMERCGVNTKEEVKYLAKLINSSDGLVFEGFQAYAGQLSHNLDKPERVSGVGDAVAKVGAIKKYLEDDGIAVAQISGAGTGTYNITGDNTIWTEIQAGSYVFMDTDYEQLGLDFMKSLTVLATVIHKRPGAAITDAGQKSCCITVGPPAIAGYPGLFATLSEEHGKIIDAEDLLEYQQRVEYLPSHCCTTVNLHDRYYCVRDGALEAVWNIAGRGKTQ